MLLRLVRPVFVLAICLGLATPAAAELRLMMFEQVGCIYCERWHAEVGDAYAKTDEGRAAPLLAINIRADLPEGVVLVSPPVLTPTFVLTDDGRELSRITGYPGEDFFWVLLAQMIAAAPEAAAAPAPAGQIGN